MSVVHVFLMNTMDAFTPNETYGVQIKKFTESLLWLTNTFKIQMQLIFLAFTEMVLSSGKTLKASYLHQVDLYYDGIDTLLTYYSSITYKFVIHQWREHESL